MPLRPLHLGLLRALLLDQTIGGRIVVIVVLTVLGLCSCRCARGSRTKCAVAIVTTVSVYVLGIVLGASGALGSPGAQRTGERAALLGV